MIKPDEYADIQIREAYRYAEDIESGRIVANRWIKLAVERFRRDEKREDLVQDLESVRRVYMFFSLLNINIRNVYKQYELLPYQAFIVLNLFLFYYRSSGRRRFRYMFLFVARKNSKTVFAVALNLYYLVMDGVVDPQSLLIASTREQATISLDYAKSIVRNSPALRKRVKPMQYMIRYNFGSSRGFMKTVASEATRLDGYNPSSAILDEIHAYPDDSLYNVVKSGILARDNPIVILISTAGTTIPSFCYTMFENGKNILNGVVEDDSFLVMLYTLDEGDDYNDPETWIKSNPALGVIMTPDDMRTEYIQAKNIASQLPNFLTKNLNIFVQGAESWIPEDVLQRTNTEFNLEKYKRQKVYIGMDLSSTRDLTSINCLFEDEETGDFVNYPIFFFANNPNRRLRQGGVDLRPWIREGLIKQCQTDTIDYDLVFETFVQLNKDYEIVAVAYDRYNSDLIIPRLEGIGINCVPFDQTPKAFNFPLKYLEKLIYDSRISFGGNPVLLWNFRNVVLYQDGNGNIKIMKNKSRDSVDGAVSLGMSVAVWLSVNLDPGKAGIEAFMDYNKKDHN